MLGIGLIGYGHWGPNLGRNLAAAGADIVAVSDLRDERLALAADRHPGIATHHGWQALLRDPQVEAVAIATPALTHFEIALACLAAGRHVLVEKPMTTAAEQARRLIAASAAGGLTLMVDHTYLYDSDIRSLRALLLAGELGEVRTYESLRSGARPAATDVDVIWDLAAHDVAILDHLLGLRPLAVAARASSHPSGMPADEACLTLTFEGGLVAQLRVDWRSPVKVRWTAIAGSRRVVRYDALAPQGGRLLSAVGESDDPAVHGWSAPAGSGGETLAAVAQEFLDCIASGRRPVSDGAAGLRVVEVLEMAAASLAQGGGTLRFPQPALA